MKLSDFEFKSEEQQQQELAIRISKQVEGYSKDGFVVIAQKEVKYRGIPYLIKFLRYYNHTNKFTKMSCSDERETDAHVTIEYAKDSEDLAKKVTEITENYNFLYHDTLHSWNDHQTLQEQLDDAVSLAERDIDKLFYPDFLTQIKDKIFHLNDFISEIEILNNRGGKNET